MNNLNILGIVVGVILILVSLPSTIYGALMLAAGLALTGVNIYAILVRQKAARLQGEKQREQHGR